MNAWTVAAELLGTVELTTGQLAQLRAIDMKYQQRLFTLLREDAPGGRAADPGPSRTRAEREPTAAELAELRAALASDVLGLLTPTQRRELPGA